MVFGIIIVILILWVGYAIGRLYFDNETIKNEVGVIAEDALTSRSPDVKEKVGKLLDYYAAKYDSEKINSEVSGDGKRMTIRFPYDRFADLGVTRLPWHFDLYVQKEAARAVGTVQQVQDALESSSNTSAQKYQRAIEKATKKPEPAGE